MNQENSKGFTLVELIVVMAIITFVIIISGSAFNAILSNTRKLTSSEESNIEGVIGLEIMRHDVERAGYGLPWISMNNDLNLPNYLEAASAPHSTYNDGVTGASRIPRAIVVGNNQVSTSGILVGTDYLGVKATSVGLSNDAQRWSYVTYSGTSAGPIPKEPKRWVSDNINNNASVIITRRENMTSPVSGKDVYAPKLIYDPAIPTGYFYQVFPAPGFAFPIEVSPQNKSQQHFVYGIDDSSSARMPFNRVNYYVARPANTDKIPTSCSSEPTGQTQTVGILYKGSVNQSNGVVKAIPVLDCVADMQVVLGWDFTDANGDGVDTYSNPDGSTISPNPAGKTQADIQNALANADELREQLKVIKIYVLAQNGRKDANYTSPSPITVGDASEISLTKSYALTSSMRNYRWKVYRIIVQPKNLFSNQ